MPIHCEIVSQDRMVYSGEADMVCLPGVDGVMEILPHHAPLLSTLNLGILRVRRQGEELEFTIAGGVVEVQSDSVTVLADAAENVLEIDVARAEAARKRAEEMLAQGVGKDSNAYVQLENALRRSKLRLDAVRRYGQAGRNLPSGSGSSKKEP